MAADLSAPVTAAVRDFAAGMGLDEIAPDASGAFVFDFQQTGRLAVLPSTDGSRVTISLTRFVRADTVRSKGAILRLGGYDAAGDALLRAGLTREGRPVLSMDHAMQGFDLPTLDRTFTALRRAFEGAGA